MKNTDWRQVPSVAIAIKEAKLKWDTGDEIIQKNRVHIFQEEEPIRLSEPSKWRCQFDKSIFRSPKLPIGIEITIDVKEPWEGYFSVESQPYRQYGRLKVKAIK